MTSLRIMNTEMDCWSTEDDELTLQYPGVLRNFPRDRDTISMMSADSTDSSRGYLNGAHESNFVAAGDIRRRLSESLKGENKSRKNLKRDPDDPSAAVLKEPWTAKVCTNLHYIISWPKFAFQSNFLTSGSKSSRIVSIRPSSWLATVIRDCEMRRRS